MYAAKFLFGALNWISNCTVEVILYLHLGSHMKYNIKVISNICICNIYSEHLKECDYQ